MSGKFSLLIQLCHLLIFSVKLIWDLMITEGNKLKSRIRETLAFCNRLLLPIPSSFLINSGARG